MLIIKILIVAYLFDVANTHNEHCRMFCMGLIFSLGNGIIFDMMLNDRSVQCSFIIFGYHISSLNKLKFL